MRGAVLADTGPLYAATDPADSRHERSLEEQDRLEAEGLKAVVSYATLQEAHALVLRKLAQARTFLRDLLRTTIFVVPTEEDHKRADRRADRILVMGDGRILEEGTHDELLRRPSVYRRLYESQFAA